MAGRSKADAIATELGDLPLALLLAGNFLAKYGRVTSPAAYLEKLCSPDLLTHPLLQGRGTTDQPTGRELHVARTFALSYYLLDATDSINALAIQILARAACLAPGEPIPWNLLVATIGMDDEDAALDGEDALDRL